MQYFDKSREKMPGKIQQIAWVTPFLSHFRHLLLWDHMGKTEDAGTFSSHKYSKDKHMGRKMLKKMRDWFNCLLIGCTMLATAFLLSLLQLIVIHCCSWHSDIQVSKPEVKQFLIQKLWGFFVCRVLLLCVFLSFFSIGSGCVFCVNTKLSLHPYFKFWSFFYKFTVVLGNGPAEQSRLCVYLFFPISEDCWMINVQIALTPGVNGSLPAFA